jgi:HK97 family phage major capsid protein
MTRWSNNRRDDAPTDPPITTAEEARMALRAIDNEAGGDDLDDAQQAAWDAAEAFLERATESERELARLVRSGSVERGQGGLRSRGRIDTHKDATLRSIEQAPFADDSTREGMTRLVERGRADRTGMEYVQAVADEDYLGAYVKVMSDPSRGHMEFTGPEAEAWRRTMRVTRDMAVGSGGSGGYAVPFSLDASFINAGIGSQSSWRQIARVEQTIGNQGRFLTVDQIDVGYDQESSEVDDDSPTIEPVDVPVFRATAFVPVSFEAFDDISALTAELAALFTDAKNNLEARKFAYGNGTSEPHGLFAALNDTVTSQVGAQAALDATDVYATLESLPPRWRQQAVWQASLLTLDELDQMETGNGAKKFPGLDQSNPILLRRAIYENSQQRGGDYLVVGDHRQYVILDRLGARTEIVPHLFGTSNNLPTGQRGVLYWWRGGAEVLVPDAFRLLVAGTAS